MASLPVLHMCRQDALEKGEAELDPIPRIPGFNFQTALPGMDNRIRPPF